MKKLALLLTCVSITACFPQYQAPTSGPIAKLTMPSNEIDFSLMGSTADYLYIAHEKESGCSGSSSILKKSETGTVETSIPAGQKTFVRYYSGVGVYNCFSSLAFVPEEHKSYVVERGRGIVEENGKEEKKCGIRVMEKSASGELVETAFEKVDYNELSGKMCVIPKA